MRRKRKRKVYLILIFLLGIAVTVSLVLYALRQNINLFFTPTQLLETQKLPLSPMTRIRVGGVVREGSISRNIKAEANALTVQFIITDFQHDVLVVYTGVLPDLFREKQGVVALGVFGSDKIFKADQILAKHDENYMPPGSYNAA